MKKKEVKRNRPTSEVLSDPEKKGKWKKKTWSSISVNIRLTIPKSYEGSNME